MFFNKNDYLYEKQLAVDSSANNHQQIYFFIFQLYVVGSQGEKIMLRKALIVAIAILGLMAFSQTAFAEAGDVAIYGTFQLADGRKATWISIENSDGTHSYYTMYSDQTRKPGWSLNLTGGSDSGFDGDILEPTGLDGIAELATTTFYADVSNITIGTDSPITVEIFDIETGIGIGDIISISTEATISISSFAPGCKYGVLILQDIEGIGVIPIRSYLFCK